MGCASSSVQSDDPTIKKSKSKSTIHRFLTSFKIYKVTATEEGDDHHKNQLVRKNTFPASFAPESGEEKRSASFKDIEPVQAAPITRSEASFNPSTFPKDDINIKLVTACKNNDLTLLKHCLKNEADINYRATFGNTPLLLCCQYNATDCATYILEGAPAAAAGKENNGLDGLDLNAVNERGCTALLHASVEGMNSIVKLLCEFPSVSINGFKGRIYHSSIDKNIVCAPLVGALLRSESDLSNVRLLLKRGAWINETDEALENHQTNASDLVASFKDKGSFDLKDPKLEQLTPPLLCCMSGNSEAFTLLLGFQGIITNKQASLAIRFASKANDGGLLLDVLHEYFVNTDREQEIDEGSEAQKAITFIWSLFAQSPESSEFFSFGMNAMHIAFSNGKYNIGLKILEYIRLAIEDGGIPNDIEPLSLTDVNARDRKGFTPLMYCVQNFGKKKSAEQQPAETIVSLVDIFKVFISFEINPRRADPHGRSAITLLARNSKISKGDKGAIEDLVKHFVDEDEVPKVAASKEPSTPVESVPNSARSDTRPLPVEENIPGSVSG